MSTLYGDNIFESSEVILNRIIESFNNESILFEDFDIINEGVIEGLKNLWRKIKELIKAAIKWIKELPKRIKELFTKKKKDIVVTKVKDAEKDVQKAKDDAFREKVESFNDKIKKMTIKFNDELDVFEDEKSFKADKLIYFITDKNKLMDNFDFTRALNGLEEAITNRDKLTSIHTTNYLFGGSDSFKSIYLDDESSIHAHIVYKGASKNKNNINYFSDERIIVGNHFDILGIEHDEANSIYNFAEELLKCYNKSYNSLQIVNDAISYCDKMYDKCNSLIDKIEKLIDNPAKDYKPDDYKSISSMLSIIGRGITATKSDLNFFVQYFTKQYKYLESIAELYAKTFSFSNPLNKENN